MSNCTQKKLDFLSKIPKKDTSSMKPEHTTNQKLQASKPRHRRNLKNRQASKHIIMSHNIHGLHFLVLFIPFTQCTSEKRKHSFRAWSECLFWPLKMQKKSDFVQVKPAHHQHVLSDNRKIFLVRKVVSRCDLSNKKKLAQKVCFNTEQSQFVFFFLVNETKQVF